MEKHYVVKSIDNKELWNDFVGGNLLQTWEYGEFWKSLGKSIWRVGVYEVEIVNNEKVEELAAVAQGLEVITRFRSHIYISNGPVFLQDQSESLRSTLFIHLLDFYKALALKLDMKFLRFDPLFEENDDNKVFMKSLGMVESVTHIQAETKWFIDLKVSEDEVFAGMTSDNRNKIRKAEKRGIEIEISNKAEDFDRFWKLFEQTFTRNRFIPNSKEYYQSQFNAFLKNEKVKVLFAKNSDGNDLSSILLYLAGDTAYYLHAASANEQLFELNHAPKLLAWKSIIEAKNLGCKLYDFYGIAREENSNDPWYGFTRFKKAFGGYRRDMLRAYDYPVKAYYWFVRFIEKTKDIWSYPYFLAKNLLNKAKK